MVDVSRQAITDLIGRKDQCAKLFHCSFSSKLFPKNLFTAKKLYITIFQPKNLLKTETKR